MKKQARWVVVFDLWWVICREISFLESFFGNTQISTQQKKQLMKILSRSQEWYTDWVLFWNYMSSIVPISTSSQELKNKHIELICKNIDSEILKIIQLLHTHYRIVLATNSWSFILEELLIKFNLDSFIDDFVTSFDLWCRKPNWLFFKEIYKITNIYQNVIYFDDKKDNIRVANQLGIKSVLFDLNIHSSNDLLYLLNKNGFKIL